MITYHIVRVFFRHPKRNRIIREGMTWKEAVDYCKDPETSSETCQEENQKKLTHKYGPWVDTYEEDGEELETTRAV